MAERILYPEWRRQNDATKFPFAELVTLINGDGRVIPEGTFLDAVIHPIGGLSGLYLSQVTVTHQTVTLQIGDALEANRCTGVMQLVNPANEVYLTDSYGRAAGVLVSESIRLSVFQAWGVGTYVFLPEQTEFAATVCVPTPEIGLRGFQLEDGTLLTGDVWFVGDDGVVFRAETVGLPSACPTKAVNEKAIRMDVVGDPLFRRRLCSGSELFATPRFIKTIRVTDGFNTFECVPDATGNIQISVNNDLANDTVLRVTNTANGVKLGAVGEPLVQ